MQPATASTLSLAAASTDVLRDTIARFASALRASSHYVTATNAIGQRLWERWWPPTLLVEAADWLAIEASTGLTISMRPWSSSRILIRGLRPGNYARLAAEHRVSAAVEVGGTVEAWLSLADRSVDARVAERTTAILAARYGGDLLGAGARTLGHLPAIPLPASKYSRTDTAAPRLLTASAGHCTNAATIALEAASAIGCDVIPSPKIARRQPSRNIACRTHPRHSGAPDPRDGLNIRHGSTGHTRSAANLDSSGGIIR